MKKFQRVYAINDPEPIPGTITEVNGMLYKVVYDCGGYDWLLADELMPYGYKLVVYTREGHKIATFVAGDTMREANKFYYDFRHEGLYSDYLLHIEEVAL